MKNIMTLKSGSMLTNLIIVHDLSEAKEHDNLRFALSNTLTRSVVIDAVKSSSFRTGRIVIPDEWNISGEWIDSNDIATYCDNFLKYSEEVFGGDPSYIALVNGRFLAKFDMKLLNEAMDAMEFDILNVTVDQNNSAFCEKPRITASNMLVGFRRCYEDTIELSNRPNDWPHVVYIRAEKLSYLLTNGNLPMDYDRFISTAEAKGLKIKNINIGGKIIDLADEIDLLNLISENLSIKKAYRPKDKKTGSASTSKGSVLAGENARIAQNAVILGPSIIEDGATIADGAVVNNSIIGSSVQINGGEIIDKRILDKNKSCDSENSKTLRRTSSAISEVEHFRKWDWYSYPVFLKRIFDILGSAIVLTLFAPIFPIIAFAIKINSPGTVFYKALRQGFHGKPIHCLKFRTMIQDADSLQDKLRAVNQVDGPQFKMEDDPRVSKVGKFLRDTCIDEIPQFVNVFLGQMSIVGPRPSPEKENSQCPQWRDARLSVRPGITGLWQISRTRRQGHDFQEWVYYDTIYAKKISFKLDLWICFKTAKKLIKDFLDQF